MQRLHFDAFLTEFDLLLTTWRGFEIWVVRRVRAEIPQASTAQGVHLAGVHLIGVIGVDVIGTVGVDVTGVVGMNVIGVVGVNIIGAVGVDVIGVVGMDVMGVVGVVGVNFTGVLFYFSDKNLGRNDLNLYSGLNISAIKFV